MMTVKNVARRILGRVPPFKKWLAELDSLRELSRKLQRDTQFLRSELEGVRSKCQDATDELERVRRGHILTFAGAEPLWTPPGHFYSPIPSLHEVKVSKEEIFELPPAIRGVDLNEKRQIELLEVFRRLYSEQPFPAEKVPDRRYFFENPNYSYPDAIVLYSMIRYLQPRRIVEIGSGYSSAAMLDVNEIFFENSIACTFIDPYPQLLRALIKPSDRLRVPILGQKVQDVDLRVFRDLGASDILFVDSSHVAKTGSDVNYIFFKILPLLNEGVYIHFHDVFYPFEYPDEWVFEGRAWNEAYLLRAFLEYNRAFDIQFFTSYMMHKHRQVFEMELPLCVKNPSGNLWLSKRTLDPELDRVNVPAERKSRPVPKRIVTYQPECAWLLGEGWHGREAGHRWMMEEAVVQIAGPDNPGERLRIRGSSPHTEGVQLSIVVDDVELGSVRLERPGPVDAEFALPESLAGRSPITLHIAVDRVYKAPEDPRTLGLSVSAIEVV
jgi:hypothetical protein